MKNQDSNYSDIIQIFDTAFDGNIPIEAEHQFQKRFFDLKNRCIETNESKTSSRHFPRRLLWSGSAVCIILLAFIAVFTVLRLPGRQAYAAAIEALQSVQSIHITGWTENLHLMIGAYSKELEKQNEPIRFDIWEWRNSNGHFRSYKQGGPFTVVDDGEHQYEYNRIRDELFIRKTGVKNYLDEVPEIPIKLIEVLDRLTISQTDLGERIIDGRLCTGLRLEKKTSPKEYCKELWFDKETNLPVEISFFKPLESEWKEFTHTRFEYNKEIPQKVSTYTGPADPKSTHFDWDIDPSFEPWRRNLRQLAARYHDRPLPERMELVPRKSKDDIPAWIYGKMPGIDDYAVRPLSLTLGDCLKSLWREAGTLRISKDLQNIQLHHDLVLRRAIDSNEQMEFLLDRLGLEMIYTEQERTVWVARYDGRELKPWKDVKAPVPRGNANAIHPGMNSSPNPTTMGVLIRQFNYYQDMDLTADAKFIINETELPEPPENQNDRDEYAVSSESPYWGGIKSIELARRWFKNEFGVTFTEEKRTVPLFIVQKK